jgi:hypothetical protein
MVELAQRYAEQIPSVLNRWREDITTMHDNGRKPAIWGSGSKCVAFLTTIGMNEEIDCVVDINPFRHGKFIPGLGREIKSPEHLRETRPDVVIVMNRIYVDEIRKQLAEMGLEPEIVAL